MSVDFWMLELVVAPVAEGMSVQAGRPETVGLCGAKLLNIQPELRISSTTAPDHNGGLSR